MKKNIIHVRISDGFLLPPTFMQDKVFIHALHGQNSASLWLPLELWVFELHQGQEFREKTCSAWLVTWIYLSTGMFHWPQFVAVFTWKTYEHVAT